MSSRTEHPSAGYTLIEMVVVLAVLGLIVAAILPRISAGGASNRARAAPGELVETLRLARGQAIASGHPVAVVIDVSKPAYRLAGRPWRLLPSSLHVSVTAVAADVPGAHLAGIIFQADGSSSGGIINLEDGAARQRISVDWLTGRVNPTYAQ